MNDTALHLGLSKYLTAQDTLSTPTLTKYDRTVSRLANLLSLQPRLAIKKKLSVPSNEQIDQKIRYISELVAKMLSFSFPQTKQNKTVFLQFDHSLFRHHLLSEITIKSFQCHFSLGSSSQKIFKLSSFLHFGFS